MSDHRGGAGNPVIAALKSARFLLSLTAVVAAIPALLALIVYLFVVGSDLEVWVVVLLLWTTVSISLIVRRGRDRPYFRWMAAGMVATAAWQLVSIWSQHRGWPGDRLHVIAVAGDYVRVASVACICVAIVTGIRSGSLRWGQSRGDS